MANSAIQSADFSNFPLTDWGQTVVRIPISITNTFNGDEVLSAGANTNVTAIVQEITRGSKLWQQLGYVEEIDAVIYVANSDELSLNDLIIVNNKTFRVLQPRTRRPGGVEMYTTAGMVLYDSSEASYMGFTVTTGDGAPSSTPAREGDIYIDTTNDYTYVATGTASNSDWKQVMTT